MTGRAITLTRETITALASARRVGATLREAAAAHGIAYPTLMRWVRQGRAVEGDPLCAELAAELDRAAAQLRQVLWSRALKATEKDGRLALDAIKHLDDAPLRRARIKLARAQAVGITAAKLDVTTNGKGLATASVVVLPTLEADHDDTDAGALAAQPGRTNALPRE